jgi:hypothetical protein
MSPSLKNALNASGYIGIWETDLATQTVELTGVLPEFLGLDEREAAAGVPISALLMGVHPQDRERVAHLVHEAHSTAGRFEAEFQTINSSGGVHRVSARGRVETDEHGHGLRCIGVALDLTDSYSEDLVAVDQRMNTIDRVVDALIAVRPLVHEIHSPVLSTLIDASLLEVGKLLAKQSIPPARHLH